MSRHIVFIDEDDCFMVECPVGGINHQVEEKGWVKCDGCGLPLFKFSVKNGPDGWMVDSRDCVVDRDSITAWEERSYAGGR